jgi:adenylate cyclase
LRATLWLYLSLVALSLFWLLLSQWEVLRGLENLSLDARYRVRGPIPSPVKLIYVDIDGKALSELGSFPWERGIFARVCDMLITHGGAKAVGIDVVFSSEGIPNVADPSKVARGQAEFGRYLWRNPPVVLAASYASGIQRTDDGGYMQRVFPRAELGRGEHKPEVPEFKIGAVKFTPSLIGLIDAMDADTRCVPIFAPTEDRDYFHISLELARLHWGIAPDGVRILPGRIELRRQDGQLVQTIPLRNQQIVDINWFSPWIHESNPRHSLADLHILHELQTSGTAEGAAAVKDWFAENNFKDAIVLIGPVDPLLQDLGSASFDIGEVPKVGVHGNMVKTIVSGRFLKTPPAWSLPVITIGLTALVVGLSLASEGQRSTVRRAIAVGVLLGYVVLCFVSFAWADWVLPMVEPLGAAFSSAFIGGAAQLVLAQKQKGRIKGLFGAYLAPAVVEAMVDSGQEPKLGGVEENITAYFSDVESFSSFSEKLSPTQLVELMNEYLTACTDIVQSEGGTLDKYIGDAVVAMFGAPLALPNHPLQACVTALRVQRRCAELREKWGHEPQKNWPEIVLRMRTRIGLNSGRAVVGNMGSASRFSYTMMGDTVNLAARMESGAKCWGVYTMCADPTRVACEASDPEGRIVFRMLGRIVVKGRSTPVPIHELVGLKEDVSDQTREAIVRFEAGLAKYYEQDWDAAAGHFQASAMNEPMQPDRARGIATNPSLVYLKLIEELRAQPPGPGWNGVFVMMDK